MPKKSKTTKKCPSSTLLAKVNFHATISNIELNIRKKDDDTIVYLHIRDKIDTTELTKEQMLANSNYWIEQTKETLKELEKFKRDVVRYGYLQEAEKLG